MSNDLPFLQDPRRFLQSYFWGCNEGYKLTLRCKQQLEPRSRHNDADAERDPDTITEALLDCYVHTKVCPRCGPLENVTCRTGYELIKDRDSALDETLRLGIGDRTLEAGLGSALTEDELQAIFNKELAEREFLSHMESCEICSVKQPRGRYSLAAWGIEAARSQRME